MENEIQALTEPGQKMVAAAEEMAATFAKTAAENDREGRFPFEHIDVVRESGYLYVPRGGGRLGSQLRPRHDGGGAFMHPLGANLAFEYIGGVALGLQPDRL